MKRLIVKLAWLPLCVLSLPMAACGQEPGGWTSLFDGKTLSGWKLVPLGDNAGKTKFEVIDGALVGSGNASMLYSPKGDYTNFKLRAEVMISDGGNSGLYFRSRPEASFGGGVEAQIDATHSDPIRTGSLYGMCHVYAQHHKPNEWFTYELEVRDDNWRGKPVTRMKVTVDGKELYEFLDFDQQFKTGHFAFQQHDPGSTVKIRKIEVMRLPDAK
jgi:hypothetical protein